MARGYVFENDCETCEEAGDTCMVCTAKERIVRELAAKWNIMHEEDEQRSFMRDEDRYDEEDYIGEMLDERAWEMVIEKNEEFANLSYSEIMACDGARIALDNARQIVEKEYNNEKQKKEEQRQAERQAIEELLSSMGARMMRPYEHWNEEESYREWAERDRGDY